LPIFPGLVRYDEVMEGNVIRHALRFTAARTRRAYVYPARHYASASTDPSLPPMGMRVRLKVGFDISGFPPGARGILQALKTYGMILADNGGNWFLSGAPDSRWNDDELNTLKLLTGNEFEVVKMGSPQGPEASLADDFDQHSFAPPPIELTVEDLLPRTEVELAARDRHHHIAPHHLALKVCVPVVLPRPVVLVLRDRLVGCEPLQPTLIVIVEAALIIVDEDGSGDMHRVTKQKPFPDSAFPHAFLDLRRDVDECPP
jgi:hypothetical protein